MFRSAISNKICILGNSFQGTALAAYLIRVGRVAPSEIRIFNKDVKHCYQYGHLDYACGLRDLEEIQMTYLKIVNEVIELTFEKNLDFHPQDNSIYSIDQQYKYDHLIVALDEEASITQIPGLELAIKEYDSGVCLINDADSITKAKRMIDSFNQQGNVFFIDQQGLNSKDHLKTLNFSFLFDEMIQSKRGGKKLRLSTSIEYKTISESIFPDSDINAQILQHLNTKQINAVNKVKLVSVDHEKKIFKIMKNDKIQEQKYDLLFLNAETTLNDSIKNSQLCDSNGKLNLNFKDLSHVQFPNIFGLGPHCEFSKKGIFHQDLAFKQAENTVMNIYINKQRQVLQKEFKYQNLNIDKAIIPLYLGKKKIANIEYENESYKIANPSYQTYWKHYHLYPWMYFNVLPGGIWFGPSRGVKTLFQL